MVCLSLVRNLWPIKFSLTVLAVAGLLHAVTNNVHHVCDTEYYCVMLFIMTGMTEMYTLMAQGNSRITTGGAFLQSTQLATAVQRASLSIAS